MWLGGEAIQNSKCNWEYVNVETGKSLNFTNFKGGTNNPFSTYNCLYLDSIDTGVWVQYPCIFKTCVVCSFKAPTVLRLRGLCEDSIIDRYYIINGEHNGKPLFSGISHSIIRATNTSWELIDSLNINLNASMITTQIDQNPVGLRQWIVNGDKCEETTLKLLLTACQAHQYTCNDGTCIEKMQRCDLTVNCPDQSDERLCIPVVVPTDYIREVTRH